MKIEKSKVCLAAYGKQAAILSDGTVVCSCFDKCKDVPLGNMNDSSFMEIWNGQAYECLRQFDWDAGNASKLCNVCSYLCETQELIRPLAGPRKLIIEYNSDCMLQCPGCERREILDSRSQVIMPDALVDSILEQLGSIPELKKIGFYNHGEPLLHEKAFSFITRIKQAVPDVEVFTSTNGLSLSSERRRRALLDSGIDTVMFSIDGTCEESYRKYRIGGSFVEAYSNMEKLIELNRRIGSASPKIIWRYILFNWNDSDDEIQVALRLAEELGVDQFCFLPTDYPTWAVSQYASGKKREWIEQYTANVF